MSPSASAMNRALEALPVELVCHIATFLDVQDVLCFRLTNHTLASKLFLHLTRFFAYKDIELALEPLKHFAYVTGQGRMGCFLQHCTIIGVVDGNLAGTPDADEHVRLLTEVFVNLKQHSPRTSLTSLHLSMVVRNDHSEEIPSDDGYYVSIDHPSRQEVFEATLQTFNTTMISLRQSDLSVNKHLDLFSGFSECGLDSVAVLLLGQQFVSTAVFSSLKMLTMSLCSPYISKKEGRAARRKRVSESLLLQCLPRLSSIMPKLEYLDFHWYTIGCWRSQPPKDHMLHLNTLSQASFAFLKTCGLRGLHISESSLLEYLKAIRPTALAMKYIHLTRGTWAPIFDFLTSSGSPVKSYCLDDLVEDGKLVHFDVPGESKFRYMGIRMGPSTLTRDVDEEKEAIRYSFPTSRMMGSGEAYRWDRKLSKEFGPPLRRPRLLE
ncbi:hypothetical protein F4777DRAFT_566470 [Nemania sp. FL0916]|nr:hypothetical protein F4777DRAFT_566470 [Nemania sp. FL0916]